MKETFTVKGIKLCDIIYLHVLDKNFSLNADLNIKLGNIKMLDLVYVEDASLE